MAEKKFKIKFLKEPERDTRLVVQDPYDPSPTVAIVNVLLLRGNMFPISDEEVSFYYLMDLFTTYVCARKPEDPIGSYLNAVLPPSADDVSKFDQIENFLYNHLTLLPTHERLYLIRAVLSSKNDGLQVHNENYSIMKMNKGHLFVLETTQDTLQWVKLDGPAGAAENDQPGGAAETLKLSVLVFADNDESYSISDSLEDHIWKENIVVQFVIEGSNDAQEVCDKLQEKPFNMILISYSWIIKVGKASAEELIKSWREDYGFRGSVMALAWRGDAEEGVLAAWLEDLKTKGRISSPIAGVDTCAIMELLDDAETFEATFAPFLFHRAAPWVV